MGSITGKAMQDNFQKHQEFMLELQQLQVDRQIQLRSQMQERMRAMEIASIREKFYWLSAFYTVATLLMISSYRKSRKPWIIAPLLPLTFYVAYQGDLAYGSKIHRVRGEAENILQFEPKLVHLPSGVPTFETIEEGREKAEEEEKLKRSHDIFL